MRMMKAACISNDVVIEKANKTRITAAVNFCNHWHRLASPLSRMQKGCVLCVSFAVPLLIKGGYENDLSPLRWSTQEFFLISFANHHDAVRLYVLSDLFDVAPNDVIELVCILGIAYKSSDSLCVRNFNNHAGVVVAVEEHDRSIPR